MKERENDGKRLLNHYFWKAYSDFDLEPELLAWLCNQFFSSWTKQSMLIMCYEYQIYFGWVILLRKRKPWTYYQFNGQQQRSRENGIHFLVDDFENLKLHRPRKKINRARPKSKHDRRTIPMLEREKRFVYVYLKRIYLIKKEWIEKKTR